FNPPLPTLSSALPLHDALPISGPCCRISGCMGQVYIVPGATGSCCFFSQSRYCSGSSSNLDWQRDEQKYQVLPPCWLRCSAVCRSEEHTSELQSRENLVCRLLL